MIPGHFSNSDPPTGTLILILTLGLDSGILGAHAQS